jgi:regulator of RNase E activity RraA
MPSMSNGAPVSAGGTVRILGERRLTAPLLERLRHFSSPQHADACLRFGTPVRCTPTSMRPIANGMRLAGRMRPARHVESVDVFLEALEHSERGDVLVVDNGGRTDEACVGDFVAPEVNVRNDCETVSGHPP